LNPPGLKVVIPATPAEAKGLMTAAIRDDGPVVFFHHRQLLGQSGEVPEGETVLPLGRSAVVREGADLTMVSCGAMLHRCLEAAEALAGEGLRAEVIDLRTIVPLDEATIAGSVAKTSRLMVVEDGRKRGGIGSEIAAVVAEKYLDLLDAPLLRVAALDTPVPFAAPLEKAHFPQLETILAAARRLVE
jgi:pyruvate dehydrogenase E1 component beta subunit